MNVYIFLDIDGVITTMSSLNRAYNSFVGESERGYIRPNIKENPILNKYRPYVSMYHWPFDQDAIDNFHKLQVCILDSGHIPQVILSSSWRLKFNTIEAIKDGMSIRGLHLMNIIGTTDIESDSRGQQIKNYIIENKLDGPILIIDDETYDINLYFGDPYIIQTKFDDGFNTECLNKACKSIANQLVKETC